MRIFVKTGIVFLILALSFGIALAQFAKTEDAIKYRKSVMQVIKKHFGSMAGVIKSKTPYDQAAFLDDANVVAMLSKLPWEASMAPGSNEGETTLNDKALKDKEGFMAVAKRFQNHSSELAAAAESGDLGKIKKKFGATAQTCGSCHKSYRK